MQLAEFILIWWFFYFKYVHFLVFVLEEVRSVHLAAKTKDRVLKESRIVVEKLCLLSCKLNPLLCLRSEIVDHDLYPGHVGHKMPSVLNIRNETFYWMLSSVKNQCRE